MKGSNIKDVKELGSLWKILKGCCESLFFKNEVIYNLMLKYGLYEKGGYKRVSSLRVDVKDIVLLMDEVNFCEKERNNKNLKYILLVINFENFLVGEERRMWNFLYLYEFIFKGSFVFDWKVFIVVIFELKKFVVEWFRELWRKYGM